MRWQTALVLCAGCDAIFGLHDRAPAIDGPASGGDGSAAACIHSHAVLIYGSDDSDGDGDPDCTDPCPIDSRYTSMTPGLIDSDGDGLPDVCDPDPMGTSSEPDCIVLLDGFADTKHPAIDDRWLSASNTGDKWQWDSHACTSGHIAFCSPIDATLGVLYFQDPLHDITTVVAEGAMFNAPASFFFDVMPDASPDGSDLDGRSCDFIGPTMNPGIDDITAGSAVRVMNGSDGLLYGSGGTLRIGAVPAATWDCVVGEAGSGSNVTTTKPIPTTPPPDGTVGIRIKGGDAEVHFIAAFATGSACE
nr:hypothetical protein [Kofleriaceae bacterium]